MEPKSEKIIPDPTSLKIPNPNGSKFTTLIMCLFAILYAAKSKIAVLQIRDVTPGFKYLSILTQKIDF
jgi:hypothetical protein